MKNFFSGAFFAIGLLASNTAMGQDVSNVGEAEIELAAAKLAVAKAEAELAQAKLDALKQETSAENSDVALIESNPEISLNSEIETSTVETPNIVNLASEAKPAIELVETANPLTSLQPNIIAGDIDTEINTDITEDVISDIGEDLVVADITDTTSGLETDIISLPDSIEDSPESDKTAIEVSTPLNEIAEPEISLPQLQLEPANVIFPGLLDLTRHDNTGPIGGCASINKGLTMGGGFMLFTCEKLLPYIEISEHKNTYDAYKNLFLSEGWSETPSQEPAKNKLSFSRVDYLECEVVVDMELWIDRSMNETILDKSDRDAYRQIVFKAWFRGDACQGHYDAAELLVGR